MSAQADNIKTTEKNVSEPKEKVNEVVKQQADVVESSDAKEGKTSVVKKPVKTTAAKKTASRTVKSAASKTTASKPKTSEKSDAAKKKESSLEVKGIVKKDAAKKVSEMAKKKAADEEHTSGIKCELPTYLL